LEILKDTFVGEVEKTILRMNVARDEKKRVIELMISAGTVLAVVTAILHPDAGWLLFYAFSLVFFAIASLSAYITLLREELKDSTYRHSVQGLLAGMGLMLSVLVTTAMLNANVLSNDLEFVPSSILFVLLGIWAYHSLLKTYRFLMNQ